MTQRPDLRPDTVAVRGGLARSHFDETAEAIYANSGFVYESAAEAAAAFDGDIDRFVYGRYGNPTVAVFEERLRLLEGAEACLATASGMAAIYASLAGVLAAGDRVVASRALFGSCSVIVNEILPRFGVASEVVDGPDLDAWHQALERGADLVLLESPSNPGLQLVDIAAVAELAHQAGAIVVVDNVFASPVLQHPLELGADVVAYSATKHIDGQGRVLGGAILGSQDYIDKVMAFTRHTGPSLSPFNAWVLLKGLETLRLRVEAQSASAATLATALEADGQVEVSYPFLASHPQYELAKSQMAAGGTLLTLSFEDQSQAFAFLDGLEIIDISNNLGDTKSLATHPATTTHRRLSSEDRARVGISDGMVRLSVGLEDVRDLQADLHQAMAQALR